jgi:hypothetical protein
MKERLGVVQLFLSLLWCGKNEEDDCHLKRLKKDLDLLLLDSSIGLRLRFVVQSNRETARRIGHFGKQQVRSSQEASHDTKLLTMGSHEELQV